MNNRFEDESIEPWTSAEIEWFRHTPGTVNNPIAAFIERLDFVARPELHDATAAIIDGLVDDNTVESRLNLAWLEYAKIVEGIVESIEITPEDPKAYASTQIEAIIHKALIFQSGKNTLRYLEELDRAEIYAYNEHFDEMSTAINNEITATVEALEMSPEVLVLKLKGIVSEDNREFLRDLIDDGEDFEDAINHVYGIILEEGGDPDEILAEMGVLDR